MNPVSRSAAMSPEAYDAIAAGAPDRYRPLESDADWRTTGAQIPVFDWCCFSRKAGAQ
jgi:hypothetical protein